MRDSIKRLGFSNIAIFKQDASDIKTGPGFADAVLVDAPCSGLGIIRRRPDIKYNRKPQDIHALVKTQRMLLHAASTMVKPGGTLVYSTCTVTREENIENIRWFTAHYPFTVSKPYLMVPNAGTINFFEEDNCLQLLPGLYNDAFFIAKMVKTHD
jgi:16S rRNA (cytosine967-C5)-methyltransferase